MPTRGLATTADLIRCAVPAGRVLVQFLGSINPIVVSYEPYTHWVVLPLPSGSPMTSTASPRSRMTPMLPLSNRSKQGRNRYLPKHECSGGLLGNDRSSGMLPSCHGVTIHTTM